MKRLIILPHLDPFSFQMDNLTSFVVTLFRNLSVLSCRSAKIEIIIPFLTEDNKSVVLKESFGHFLSKLHSKLLFFKTIQHFSMHIVDLLKNLHLTLEQIEADNSSAYYEFLIVSNYALSDASYYKIIELISFFQKMV